MNAPHPVQVYVGFMTALAVVCPMLLDWTTLESVNWFGLSALIALGIISEWVAISVTVARSAGHSSITFIPFLTSVLLFGPAAGLILSTTTMVIGEIVLHRKPAIKTVFNVSQWVVISVVSGLVYVSVGGLVNLDLSAGSLSGFSGGRLLIPFGAFVIAVFSINYILVSGVIALDKGLKLSRVVQMMAASAGANLVLGILSSPIAIVVAILYRELQVPGLFIALLPLIFIRRSYQNTLKLQRANRDLLKALVKAIEIRDPYTSGHSLRVSSLASRIAVALGLSERKVEEVETAALLHDIGKIEAVYTKILGKPGELTETERQIIESHVTKGEELLQSISSFPPSVVDAVRHHHEREDGTGYPDGLRGHEIPLGAKIINVCDAIDAMLSDRPYRKALTLAAVREQLIIYAGTQFDVKIVSCVVNNDILEVHKREVAASKEWSPTTLIDHGRGPLPDAAETTPKALTLLGGDRRRSRRREAPN